VLDRSPSIGVRGEYTQDYLNQLGFRDVEVIGCPSMFLSGDQLTVTKPTPTLDRDARVAINITTRVGPMSPLVTSHVANYPNLEYIVQDRVALNLMLWGEDDDQARLTHAMPIHRSHPLFRDDKALCFVDPWPWLQHMRTVDFTFGTRIHGNIAALLAGRPGYVIAHDTRTLELARYFEIPHRLMPDLLAGTDAAELYAEADYTALNQGHPARFATFTKFLTRHGLGHVFAEGEDPTSFDRRAAETNYPPGVGPLRDPRAKALGRLKRLNYQVRGSPQTGWNRAPGAARTRVAAGARNRVK
jgi:hypothetical protein